LLCFGSLTHHFPIFLSFPFSHQGDNVDRGAGTIDVYKLLQKLRGQASAAGGAVSISFPLARYLFYLMSLFSLFVYWDVCPCCSLAAHWPFERVECRMM
jgi:hypothetical protein